jgi:transcription antitermination factor NusG
MTDAAPAKPANPRHKWYIVNAYSNFEKKVAEQLRDQAKQQGLEDAFSEILVPTEDVVEIRRGRKVNSERKFFPGYVLVKMEMTDQAYHLVKNTPKVTGFLGAAGGTKPLPVSEREVQNIIGQVEEGVRTSEAHHPLRHRREGQGHRRPLRQLRRFGRERGRGTGPPARRRLDLRPRHTGRAGIRPGGEGHGLIRRSRSPAIIQGRPASSGAAFCIPD